MVVVPPALEQDAVTRQEHHPQQRGRVAALPHRQGNTLAGDMHLLLSRVQGTVRAQTQAVAAHSVPGCDKGTHREVLALQRETETRLHRRIFVTCWRLRKSR